jgi:ureidoglycolate dehydrogenase (NAD+)
MGYYSLMAAKEGMAGIATVCSPPNMAIFGARAAGLHNSPLTIAVPGNRREPIVLDMATSVAAGGKVELARDKGVAMPDDWALDADGNPTTDPNLSKILRPFGGPKGSGLALMFECLASLMAGNPLLEPALSGKPTRPMVQNSVIAAVDIGTFTDADAYRDNVDKLVDRLKELPTADGFDQVMVPGEPENASYQDRSARGIPLPAGTVANLQEVANRFEVPMPSPV